jgi:hypothetical protein
MGARVTEYGRSGQRSGHWRHDLSDADGDFPPRTARFEAVKYPVIRRPMGGWGARQWRREVAAWVWAALMFAACWASGNLILALVDMVGHYVAGDGT